MPEQPAEVVARMKRSYPRWTIKCVERGRGLIAHRGSEHLWAPDAAAGGPTSLGGPRAGRAPTARQGLGSNPSARGAASSVVIMISTLQPLQPSRVALQTSASKRSRLPANCRLDMAESFAVE
jgi:hypothetical protein